MRIFFIVVVGVLFAEFITSGLRRLDKITRKDAEKSVGMTEDEFNANWMKEHPKSWFPLLPFFWLLFAGLGFLWAVFWH